MMRRGIIAVLLGAVSLYGAPPKTRAKNSPAAPKAADAAAGLVYVGVWGPKVLVFDEASEKIIDEIPLQTDVPRSLTLSNDKKKLFVGTWKDNGIEVIDLASRKVINSFKLDTPQRRLRLGPLVPGPKDDILYATHVAAVKKIDRFEIEKPKWAVIDLAQQKVTREVEFTSSDDAGPFAQFASARLSPDGKFIYMFRDAVYVYETESFKEVDKIELYRPIFPGMERVNFGPGDDPHGEPGTVTSVFNSSDPAVHRSVFGIARFDLVKRTFDFTPVGPAVNSFYGLRLTPDRKTGYTVSTSGSHGNRRSEFWTFDMDTKQVTSRVEFPSRTRFSFSISSNGKMLYIFGAGNTLEIYDAATGKLRKEIDVNADMSTNLVVLPAKDAANLRAGR